MGIYFGTTEITGLYFGDTEITGLYFGDTEIWAAWAEYDGTLPAQYTANGDYLADYRVYGSAGGVGDRTVNIYNYTATNSDNGYMQNYILKSDGTTQYAYGYSISEYIPVLSEAYYILDYDASLNIPAICFYDAQKQYISGTQYYGQNPITVESPVDAAFCRFVVANSLMDTSMLTPGSTAPAEYVPYGYEVNMSVSDGTTSTTTPIYIGSDPLEAIGEFVDCVDYNAQKIIRKIIKIEFTGKEYWRVYNDLYYIGVSNYINSIWGTTAGFSRCSHFVPTLQPDEDGEYGLGGLTPYDFSRWNGDILFKFGTSLEDFKTYLATQKAAGTPVTVWYVCENPIEENPPVPLPALPTVDGTNIVDYAGQSAAPSRFYAKYKKG